MAPVNAAERPFHSLKSAAMLVCALASPYAFAEPQEASFKNVFKVSQTYEKLGR